MICLLLSVSLACTVTAVKTDCWCKLDAGDPANTQGLQGVRNTAKPAVPSREGIMVKSGPVSPSTGDASMFILRTPLRKQRFYLRAATRSLLVTSKPLVSFLSFLLVLFRLGAARVPWQSIPKKKKKTQTAGVLPCSVWKNNFLMIKRLHCTYLTEKLWNSLMKHSQPNTVSSKIYF